MEDMGCIGGIVLAETIRSLDRAAFGFDNWTVSLIILQRPRRTALLSALEGWAQVGTDDMDGTDEEIVMAPRTGEVGEGLAPKDDIEDVAPHRRRDA
ncbi:hypothetical protein JCGZ_03658 [Jatropha curcas]|uniref:Uncharacterized protein n=1 Tax=Jatropha curcas TaxID=180498 RepID=A0A067JD44_JATCU|nr:hypothetical protein JCGZ_03658 [Jatropha curcas]